MNGTLTHLSILPQVATTLPTAGMMSTICGMNSTTKAWPRCLNPASRMLKPMCSSISKPVVYWQTRILSSLEYFMQFNILTFDYLVAMLMNVLCVPVTERAMRMHWKNVGGCRAYSTWWSPASCSSTSPGSGLTSSRPLLSLGPSLMTTSCVYMEVRTIWLHYFPAEKHIEVKLCPDSQ